MIKNSGVNDSEPALKTQYVVFTALARHNMLGLLDFSGARFGHNLCSFLMQQPLHTSDNRLRSFRRGLRKQPLTPLFLVHPLQG